MKIDLPLYFPDQSVAEIAIQRRATIEQIAMLCESYADDQFFLEVQNWSASPPELSALIASLYKDCPLLQQALILHGLRQVIHETIKPFFVKKNGESAMQKMIQLLVPNIRYVLSDYDKFSTIDILVDGSVAAIFKPGDLRQQRDNLLANLYEFLVETASFPKEMPPCFIKSIPMTVRFSEIEVTKRIPYDDGLCVENRKNGKLFLQFTPFNKNLKRFSSQLSGGVQEFLPVWPEWYSENDPFHLLLMVSMVCLIGGRDVKEDGIRGLQSGTVVDCEEFLEAKVRKNGEKLPRIHIPFIQRICQVEIEQHHIERLQRFYSSVKSEDLERFVRSVQFEARTQTGDHQFEVDDRSGFDDKKPLYKNNALLSEAQITELLYNFQHLLEIFSSLKEETHLKILNFVMLFDPSWKESMVILSNYYHATVDEDPESRRYFPEEESVISRWYRSGIYKPADIAGWYSGDSPEPTEQLWQDPIANSLRSSSPLSVSGSRPSSRLDDEMTRSSSAVFFKPTGSLNASSRSPFHANTEEEQNQKSSQSSLTNSAVID